MKRIFSWENFDIRFLRSIVYSNQTRITLRPMHDLKDKILLLPYMDSISPQPDEHFVKHYHNEIMDYFFAGSTHLVSIIRELERKNYRGVQSGAMEDMLSCLRGLRLSSTVLTLTMAELLAAGKQTIDIDNDSVFNHPKTISLSTSIANNLPLHDFQKEAVERLIDHYINKDKTSGVLVMPTGSGKTRVATKYLLQEMVGRGYQVIWLTHRAMLIEQAADSIYLSAPVIRFQDPHKETFKMVCVSGQHETARALEKDDDVMIFSVQTLCRNLDFLKAALREMVMIIVDEAHHTLAPSYRLIIDYIRKFKPSAKLLGLTATPVRINDRDTEKLMQIYGNNVIYSVSMSTLIAKGVLATPYFTQIDTNIDFDTTITLDEKKYIQKWGELPPVMMERIAHIAERNEMIVNAYMKNRENYGKTLIFALNATHCISLCEALQKNGVSCDYIYCEHSGNEEKISKFRKGELDVLVNINVLTEGSDVPDIQTVFLTRPTTSDVLLMQMIGRGMRGKQCGGTETVNIVDFHDAWGSFAMWLNPKFLMAGNLQDDEPISKANHNKPHLVPYAMIRDLFDAVRTCAKGDAYADMIISAGWYDILDEDGNDKKILVFESQLSGYQQMWKDREAFKTDLALDGEWASDRYFDGFGWMPSSYDLLLLMNYYRLSGEMPHLYPVSGRLMIDAYYVGQRLKEEDARLSDIDREINQLYSEHQDMIDSIYGGLEPYAERVNDSIRYPNGIKPLGTKIDELPWETYKLDPEPAYDLDQLAQEIIQDQFDGRYELPPIRWTDRPYTSYFGVYQLRDTEDASSRETIKINCLLNSKDVPREAVKYVLYHEMLHRYFLNHGKEFRAMEHKYPYYTEHEHFLDFTFPHFDLRFAL